MILICWGFQICLDMAALTAIVVIGAYMGEEGHKIYLLACHIIVMHTSIGLGQIPKFGNLRGGTLIKWFRSISMHIDQ